ncbi:hydrogenase expression/formation protein HupK [Marinobacterium zhoushanense]|uniref:Hydrogenase expression/formation protein HupK n=1 Tax=Marinobacterium zhoushanense TaxID=1679163 RepID=A0ABQ1JYQ1_9GAMM|nr:nickel-dependent hydrogenase large subunit [Marinobacterium zhoushanense]GGB78694.1 hydrogenase expression/formation protein HupK [Marinobacterium zhoushanense]
MHPLSAGRLQVALTYQQINGQGRIAGVELELTRPVNAICQLLKGQTPEAALAMIGALFSICRHAHQVAGARALEQARAEPVAQEESRRRVRVVAAERVRESLLRLLQDWRYPGTTDAELRDGIRLGQRVLARLQASLDRPCADVEAAIAGLQHWWRLIRRTPAEERHWLETRVRCWQGIELGGAVPVLTPTLTDPLICALERERGGEFCTAPLLEDVCRHSGPAAAAASVSAADQVIGLALRALLDQVDAAFAQLAEPSPESPPGHNRSGNGVGYGWAMTARGWLLHRVELDGERVGRWQILAPTDWNFHTDGIVLQRLMGVKIERSRAQALAQDLILSIDPCVGFGVTLQDA